VRHGGLNLAARTARVLGAPGGAPPRSAPGSCSVLAPAC